MFETVKDRGLDELVFDKDANGLNEYMLRWDLRQHASGVEFHWVKPHREGLSGTI